MAKHVKNPGGGIHSVPDDFEAPQEWGIEGKDWAWVTEDEAREAVPHLFGEPHPDVVAAEIHDRGTDEKTEVSEDASLYPGDNVAYAGFEPEPQPVDADGKLIPVPTDEGEPEVPAPDADAEDGAE
jgi:hypothetical protein